MGKRALIVGAGVAGLSAASYLQRNGFETEIFESHDRPGGLCTAWERKGFTFDGCIHWLMGSGKSSNLHAIWEELGAGGLEYHEWDEHLCARLADGDDFHLYTDPDRLEAEILRLSPADGRIAKAFSRNVRRASRIDLPAAMDRMTGREKLALLATLPSLAFLMPWMGRSLSSLVSGAKSPALRDAFERAFGGALDLLPAGALFLMLGFMAKKSAGYPLGGSLAFARALEAKYLSLGGRIRYGSKVDEILVEGGKAVGLRGSWGDERGDYVVSAADGRDTLRRMLGSRFPHPGLEDALDGKPGSLEPYPSLIYVSLGLGREFPGVPHMQAFTLAEPLLLEGGALPLKRLGLRLFNFDPSMAPAGKTAATVMIETRNDAYWTELRERDRAAYQAEKEETARKVIQALSRYVPGLAESVEVVDVATPASFSRYTGNWRGSYEGWLPKRDAFGKRISKTVPGLSNFYMIGQWLNPGGGLPPCGMDGRSLAKTLCKREGLRFSPA